MVLSAQYHAPPFEIFIEGCRCIRKALPHWINARLFSKAQPSRVVQTARRTIAAGRLNTRKMCLSKKIDTELKLFP